MEEHNSHDSCARALVTVRAVARKEPRLRSRRGAWWRRLVQLATPSPWALAWLSVRIYLVSQKYLPGFERVLKHEWLVNLGLKFQK